MSIENQRNILTAYAKENGLIPYEFIYDDGYSGTDWDRPAFNRLLAEVEAGNVASCVVKDLSRFGRDYLKVGFYSEILFPKFDVRLVALGDNVDSQQGENDLTPIVNLFNEWFVKSTSQKIRAVWQDKGKRGERLAVIPPYGYRKAEDNPKQLVIDEESAAVVRRIFRMSVDGFSPAQIARMKLKFKVNPPERDEYGYLHDFEKTWLCFTITVKKADSAAVNDAFEFVEQYMNDNADIPCDLQNEIKCAGGVHTDILAFDRDKSLTRQEQADVIRAALDEAKAALFIGVSKKTA